MFEDIFESVDSNQIKTEPQRAAERLIKRLEKYERISQLEYKKLIKAHVKGKFA
jgi:SPX domain protein involved in polyphosphate accumulation